MNRESVDVRRIKPPCDRAEGEDMATKPGDFCWDFDSETMGGKREDAQHVIYLQLPGEGSLGAIHVRRGTAGGDRVWGWDGNEEKPTLTPSILLNGVWHGHLIQGRLRSD